MPADVVAKEAAEQAMIEFPDTQVDSECPPDEAMLEPRIFVNQADAQMPAWDEVSAHGVETVEIDDESGSEHVDPLEPDVITIGGTAIFGVLASRRSQNVCEPEPVQGSEANPISSIAAAFQEDADSCDAFAENVASSLLEAILRNIGCSIVFKLQL